MPSCIVRRCQIFSATVTDKSAVEALIQNSLKSETVLVTADEQESPPKNIKPGLGKKTCQNGDSLICVLVVVAQEESGKQQWSKKIPVTGSQCWPDHLCFIILSVYPSMKKMKHLSRTL